MKLVKWIDAKTAKLSPRQMDHIGSAIIVFGGMVTGAATLVLILFLAGTLK